MEFVPAGERRPEFGFRSILRALWKRKLLIVLIWATVTGIAMLSLRRMVPVYSAAAAVLAVPERIPDDRGSGAVSTDLRARLEMLKQQALSDDRLAELVRELHLDAHPAGGANTQAVERLRRAIEFTVEREWSAAQPGVFWVRYQSPDPALAARVANRVAHWFAGDGNPAAQAASPVSQQEHLEQYDRMQSGERSRGRAGSTLGPEIEAPAQIHALLKRALQKKAKVERALATAQQSGRQRASTEGGPEATEQNADPATAVRRKRVADLESQLTAASSEVTVLQEIARIYGRNRNTPAAGKEAAPISPGNPAPPPNPTRAGVPAEADTPRKPEKFSILADAAMPREPIGPGRAPLASAGCLLGLGFALLIGWVVERKQDRILGEWELPAETPVLARVPVLPGEPHEPNI